MPWWGWMLIVIAILVVILVVLYIVGNRLQKKQSAQKEAMLQAAQPVTMLVIDKKMLPMKDANLPKQVLESTPKRYQKAKLPIVKAKIGPQIINLICDDGIFDVMPVRGEVKAMVSGIYITSVKNVRGKKAPEPAKKSFSQKLRAKQKKYEQTYEQETASMKLSKEETAAKKSKGKGRKRKGKEDPVIMINTRVDLRKLVITCLVPVTILLIHNIVYLAGTRIYDLTGSQTDSVGSITSCISYILCICIFGYFYLSDHSKTKHAGKKNPFLRAFCYLYFTADPWYQSSALNNLYSSSDRHL